MSYLKLLIIVQNTYMNQTVLLLQDHLFIYRCVLPYKHDLGTGHILCPHRPYCAPQTCCNKNQNESPGIAWLKDYVGTHEFVCKVCVHSQWTGSS